MLCISRGDVKSEGFLASLVKPSAVVTIAPWCSGQTFYAFGAKALPKQATPKSSTGVTGTGKKAIHSRFWALRPRFKSGRGYTPMRDIRELSNGVTAFFS